MTEGPSEDDPNGSLQTVIIASDTWLGIRHSGSGTTLSAVMSIGGSWVSAHLGDSRCYRVSGRGVWRTRDQSAVEDLFRAGMITEDEMNTHPRSNVMDVCMGLGEARRTVFDDLGDDWDRLVLCSDGAFGYMGAEDFRTVLGASGSAEDIVDAAYERGSTDNITAVLIEKSRRA